jgi:hypothetical protein
MMSTNIFSNIELALTGAANNLFYSFVAFLPNLIGAIIVFVVGWMLGNFLRMLTIKLSRAVRLPELVKNEPLEKFLTESGFGPKVEIFIGETVRFFVVLVFFIAAINLLGLTAVSMVLTGILAYIPNVVAAILILVLGTVVAGLVESLVKGSLGAVEFKTSRLLGKTASYMVLVFSILASLSQLNIAQDFIQILFIGFVATISIGLGLSIGLGSKDLVSRILDDWYITFKKDTKN